MANPSLAALLAAVEYWQQFTERDNDSTERALMRIDCDALRAAAHQHAEALRQVADCSAGAERCENCKAATDAAADFLEPPNA